MDLQGSKEQRKGPPPKSRVKVAIRVRPMINKQKIDNESSCIEFKSDTEIVIGTDRSYKFDRVFTQDSPQKQLYTHCIRQLVLNCFDGYNAAVLAYGQTGSGKTYSMGTAINTLHDEAHTGIIPRVIHEIFEQVQFRRQKAEFIIKASFLQIYNEQIIDLLADGQMKGIKNKDTNITIREQKDGSVSIYGVNEEKVSSAQQMVKLLEKGGFNRTTASTLMNEASSRSHAIFTIFIEQHLIEDLQKAEGNKQEVGADQGFMTAKFFFVDLAGSERAKKTGATGATFREGVNINLGLLELGNVISALATIQKKQDQFITFRNSKLTRILQDCLGGNSNTYMIACVSPAESNFQQSLNTLKYASKAMNIKNTPVINRDPQSALISQLRQKVFQLQSENRRLKQMLNSNGVVIHEDVDANDQTSVELKKIKQQNRVLIKKYTQISDEMQYEKHRVNELQIKMCELRRDKDIIQLNFQQMMRLNPQLKESQLSRSLMQRFEQNQKDKLTVLEKHLQQIQVLEGKVADKDNLFNQLQREYEMLLENSKKDEKILIKKNNLLYSICRENAQLKKDLTKINQKKIEQNLEVVIPKISAATERLNEELDEVMMLENTEVYEHDEQIKEHEESYNKKQQQTQQEIDQMDKYILEREQFLEKMSKERISMEIALINQQKDNNHKKIMDLEAALAKERARMSKAKDQSTVVEKNRLANKIQNLENELKEFKKKDKEQKNMEKLVDNQSHKIKELAEEIKKFKVQKIELARKLKEDKDNFDKLKSKRIKDLFNAKKENLKKDSQIRKLTSENVKKNMMFSKKDEQLKKIKRVNQTLKKIVKPLQRRDTISSTITSSNSSLVHSVVLTQIDERALQKQQQDYLSHIIKLILVQIDREQSLLKYQLKMQQSQRELQLLLNDDSMYKLKLQRLRLKQEQQLTEEQVTMRDELQLSINDLKQRIAICEDSINFCKNKYRNIFGDSIQYFDIDSYILYNKNYQNLDALKYLVKATFNSMKNLLFQNYNIVNQREQRQLEVKTLKEQICELREQIMNLNQEYHANLVQMREEMMMNRLYSSMDEQEIIPIAGTVKRIQEKQKKELEKKIQDLTKTNRQVTSELQKTRRKCEVVQEKYQNIKNLVSKDKNIGRQEEPTAFVKPDRRSANDKQSSNKVMMEELDNMLDNIDKLKKVKSTAVLQQNMTERQREGVKEDKTFIDIQSQANRWECVGKVDAHNSSILSIAVHSNFLISTATKSLKIWDLQTRKLISQLNGLNLMGPVKYVMIDPDRRLFFTACDKSVTIWDLITLQAQGTLKCHKDQVRTIHSHGDYLFTGGKGSSNGGSLLVWDFRKLNFTQAFQQKQKNQDIFTFTSHQNILYYGTRNHSVRRMNIGNLDILSPFEPPHMDSVTGLTISRNKLISGSKDKNLRLWSLDHPLNNAKHTLHVFNDYVNTVQSPSNHSIFYAGSKDGQVKVCQTKNDRIQVLGGILAHTQSVNSICVMDQNPYSIISASQDRTIKIWQPNKQTMENLAKQTYY